MIITTPLYTTRDTCRVSGEPLQDVLSLGKLHLSGFVEPGTTLEPPVPLTLAYAPKSGLVQLRDTVNADALFRRYYYKSGTNEMMRRHLDELVQDAIAHVGPLEWEDAVIDIGCNDGTLLSLINAGYPIRVGFDPSDIHPGDGSVDVFINDYFNVDAARQFAPAKLVFSIAMFYDVSSPVAFARDVASILADDGLWVIEGHYLPAMLATVGFDAICHEHLEIFGLRALDAIMELAGLRILDASLHAVNGGSLRIYVGKRGNPTPQVATLHAMERAIPAMLDEFAAAVPRNRAHLRRLLAHLQKSGKRVAAIGASTKLNTMLQYYDLGPDDIAYIADRDPRKVGLVTAGTNIPIVSEEAMREDKPDFLLVGPYHFLPALMERERAWLDAGGRFIVPVPSPRVVG